MTKIPMPSIADEPAGVAAAAVAAENTARAAGDRGDIERELAADPWHLVRRACQVADYELDAAGSPEPDGR